MFKMINIVIAIFVIFSYNLAFASSELIDFINSNKSIIERLNKGEIVEINDTKIIKVNGVVYALGKETEESKAYYKERIEEIKQESTLRESRKYQLELETIKKGF